jgi:2-amino-4-hydroxy-6-hydroxymethyldihydropteridine diphosphokinase
VSISPEATAVARVTLGSNVGSRTRALACLRAELQHGGVVVEAASSEILTRAVGVTAQADFHNQVVRLRAPEPWAPHHWLMHCKRAEQRCGRRETYRWGPRVADADVLLLGESGEIRVDEGDLTVPHPELRHRPFLARLLRELGVTAS